MAWCIEPFINASHTTDGHYQPCCIAQVDKTAGRTTENLTPIEAMNTQYMQDLRAEMNAGTPGKLVNHACSNCIFNESHGVKSRRQKQNNKYQNEKTMATVNRTTSDPSSAIVKQDLEYVNLKMLGNICNLKCVMCNPASSSKIAAEYKKHGMLAATQPMIANPMATDNRVNYLNNILEILETVNRFSLIGGEAFVHPDFEYIFEKILTVKNIHKLELFIITNGTVIPDYVLKSADRFKNLLISFSVDGIGKKAEYIRTGTEWEVVDENIKLTLQSNASIGFNVTGQVLNAGYLHEVYDYIVNSLGLPAETASWDNIVTNPQMHNMINLPDKLKEQYLSAYNDSGMLAIPGLKTQINTLKLPQQSSLEFTRFIKNRHQFDKIRNTDLLECYPEFIDYQYLLENK